MGSLHFRKSPIGPKNRKGVRSFSRKVFPVPSRDICGYLWVAVVSFSDHCIPLSLRQEPYAWSSESEWISNFFQIFRGISPGGELKVSPNSAGELNFLPTARSWCRTWESLVWLDSCSGGPGAQTLPGQSRLTLQILDELDNINFNRWI